MSPLILRGTECIIPTASLEIDGLVKVQPVEGVEEKLLRRLGWTNLEFLKERCFETYTSHLEPTESQAQVYYEFGIFSTIYKGWRTADWIRDRINGPSISVTIPPSPKKLRGLNFYFNVETTSHIPYVLPLIKFSNITKNQTWIYNHCIEMVKLRGKGYLNWLSHWMFGANEMNVGDHITIIVAQKYPCDEQVIKECGISLVYDKHGMIEEEEGRDVLGYYKSWNHIIGGDLSGLQLTTGEYILNSREFKRCSSKPHGCYRPFINDVANFKEERGDFKAFAQEKCGRPSHVVVPHVPLVSADRQDNEDYASQDVLEETVPPRKQKEAGLPTLLFFGIGALIVTLLTVHYKKSGQQRRRL